tara:strand:- start:414 stop:653 length:240 start_codon:yes stop_codon:yes gene_type:complete
MDPHTAVAADAVMKLKDDLVGNTVILSTAHPAKFPQAIANAGLLVDTPDKLSALMNKEETAQILDTKDNSIFEYIKENN